MVLIAPTLLGILLLNFAVLQFLPGGPIDELAARYRGTGDGMLERISGGGDELHGAWAADGAQASAYRGARGLAPELVRELERQFGMDRPAHERFVTMLANYLQFDFGESFFRDRAVIDLVIERLPVSISLGLWGTLLTYLISIPLGIAKAVRDGSRFDVVSSTAIIIGYAIPGFLFAVLLVVLFAGGTHFDLFPLRGLISENWHELGWPARIRDYLWHMTLPLIALSINSFAMTTLLTKNLFLDEIGKHYVVTARAKGLTERRVLYGHVFRNAMLIVIAGFPAAFIHMLFGSALLIEIIFSLEGLGLLGYEAALYRDYPVVLGTLYTFTLLALVLNLIGDLMYVAIDPRIDFASRQV